MLVVTAVALFFSGFVVGAYWKTQGREPNPSVSASLTPGEAAEQLLKEWGSPSGGRFETLYGCPAPCKYVNDEWNNDNLARLLDDRSKNEHPEARKWFATWEANYIGDGWWLIDTKAAGKWLLSEEERRVLACDLFVVPDFNSTWGSLYPAEEQLCTRGTL